MIRVRGHANIAACESLLAQIVKGGPDLHLAERLGYAACGGSASLVQMICTWARRNERSRLIPLMAPGKDLSDLVRRPHGLAAILMASAIAGRGDNADISKAAYAAARDVTLAMNERHYKQTVKGRGLSLVCADETSLRYIEPFYSPAYDGTANLRGELEFMKLGGEILRGAVNDARALEVRVHAPDVGMMIHELIDNTDRYARHDAEGRQYRKSIRGLYATSHLVDPDFIETHAGDYGPLSAYLTALSGSIKAKRIQLLELSIFDSGPGFAARAFKGKLPDDFPLDREWGLVQSRFGDIIDLRRDGGGKGLQ